MTYEIHQLTQKDLYGFLIFSPLSYEAAALWQIMSRIPEQSYALCISMAVKKIQGMRRGGGRRGEGGGEEHSRACTSTAQLLNTADSSTRCSMAPHNTWRLNDSYPQLVAHRCWQPPLQKNRAAGNKQGVLIEAGGPKSMDI